MSDTDTKIINFRPPKRPADALWWRMVTLLVFGVSVFLTSVVALNWQLIPGHPPLKAGDTAPETLRSPRRATYISQLRTRVARDEAAAQVTAVFDFDTNLLRQLRGRAADFLRSVSAIRADTTTANELRRQQVVRLEPGLSARSVDILLELNDADSLAVSQETLRILDEGVRDRIRAEEIADKRSAALAQIGPGLSPEQHTVVSDLLMLYIRPNVLVNQAETERLRRDIRDRIPPVQVTVDRGDVVVRQGDVITPEEMEKLSALGLGTRAFDLQIAGGMALYAAVLVALLCAYLYGFQPELLSRPRSMLLVGLLLVGFLIAMKLILPGRPWVTYAFPVAVASMLISNLLSPSLALVTAVLLALLSAPVLGFSFETVCLVLVQGVAGALAARRIERLNAFFLAGLQVALAGLAVTLTFRLINQDYDWMGIANLALASGVNGLLSAIVTMGTFSLVGTVFGLTTMLQLLELAHPNQPLLRRLLTEAPGTYHHSIIVGNLAERAAEQIGVDSLLVRVGAYYHDIGKLSRPYYFAENQLDGDNIHDRLRPEVSAQAVIDHVTAGLEMARQYRLPPAVQSFIPEHHGTRLASFFYRMAVKADGSGAVDEAKFRYPGPKPRHKATALVMLADTVEASVRAASNRSTQSLEQLVERAINERLLEGELDECDLTLKDLETIKRSFTRQLRGIYHPRIEYPEPQELEPAQLTPLNAAEPS